MREVSLQREERINASVHQDEHAAATPTSDEQPQQPLFEVCRTSSPLEACDVLLT